MANRWKTMETVTDFIFLGSTITGDCSHEFKTSKLSSWKESYDKPREYIKKERHHFADKHLYSQRYGFFPVVIYGCVSWSWAIEMAEHQRIDVFKLWCCRRLLRVPWTARISILNIHWKYWCWSWSSNTLATWCIKLNTGKHFVVGKDRRQEEKGPAEDEMVGWPHQLNESEFEQTPEKWRTRKPGVLQSMGVTKSWTQVRDWTTTAATTAV